MVLGFWLKSDDFPHHPILGFFSWGDLLEVPPRYSCFSNSKMRSLSIEFVQIPWFRPMNLLGMFCSFLSFFFVFLFSNRQKTQTLCDDMAGSTETDCVSDFGSGFDNDVCWIPVVSDGYARRLTLGWGNGVSSIQDWFSKYDFFDMVIDFSWGGMKHQINKVWEDKGTTIPLWEDYFYNI